MDWFDPDHLKEGAYITAGSGGVALPSRAPHSNAAKVAINWLLTREGQANYERLFMLGEEVEILPIDVPKRRCDEGARWLKGDGSGTPLRFGAEWIIWNRSDLVKETRKREKARNRDAAGDTQCKRRARSVPMVASSLFLLSRSVSFAVQCDETGTDYRSAKKEDAVVALRRQEITHPETSCRIQKESSFLDVMMWVNVRLIYVAHHAERRAENRSCRRDGEWSDGRHAPPQKVLIDRAASSGRSHRHIATAWRATLVR